MQNELEGQCRTLEGTSITFACNKYARWFPEFRLSDKDKISFWKVLHWAISIFHSCFEAWSVFHYFFFFFFFYCSQSRLLIKSEKKLWSLADLFFQSIHTQRRSALWFLVVKTDLLGSSKRSVQVVCLILVEIMSFTLGCTGQSGSCPPSGFWGTVWLRPWL